MARNLKVSSFNCTGFKYRNYEYLKQLFSKCDILLLQETWLYKFQHSQIENVLVGSQHHAMSAMDDSDVGRVGRPYGGCAVVWHQSLALALVPVNTSTPRLCAVATDTGNSKLLIVSVYMPNDDNSDVNFYLYGDVLSELSSLIALHDGYDIILGGDFNVDFDRPSRNLTLMLQFLTNEALVRVSTVTSNGNYTYESATGNRSAIDHFLVSESINNSYSGFSIVNDALNLSHHLPIQIETNLSARVALGKSKSKIRSLDWDKATPFHLSNYKLFVDFYLGNLDVPDYVFSCNNLSCKSHNDDIMSFLEVIINVLDECARITIPCKKVGHSTGIPGWNEYVRPFKEKSLFWHQVWVNAGCPAQGQLANLRRHTRRKYHWAIKHVKRNKDDIIRDKTARLLMNKSFRDFWIIMKQLKGGSNTLSGIVDGFHSDFDIANRFKDIYSDLYNSVPDNGVDEITTRIEGLIEQNCKVGNCSSASCHNITLDIVKDAVSSLSKDKDDETYYISSNNFIHGTENLFALISDIFGAMIKHGCCNALFSKAVIKPIPKNKHKSSCDSANYRAISKNAIIGKLLDYVLIALIKDKLSTSQLQCAYKKDYSTTLCTFMVMETIQYYCSRGSNVYALLLDATKAFDKVNYNKLFDILIGRNICPLIIRLLLNMYLLSSAVVSWNGVLSDSFTISNGVKQGGVISPLLFSVYFDPLLRRLHNTKLGCYMGGICSNAFAYADDVIILSPTCHALKRLITICENYGVEYDLTFNPTKCVLLIFGDSNNNINNVNITMFGRNIETVFNEKHLGHLLSSSGSLINIEPIINDMKIRTNVIINNFHSTSKSSKVNLFNSQCMALYGCPLWNLQDRKLDELFKTWRVCCRRLLELHPRTKSCLLPDIMNTFQFVDIIKERMINFIMAGLNHPSNEIANHFKNCLLSCSSYIVSNVNIIIRTFNMKYEDIFIGNKRKVRRSMMESDKLVNWQTDMIKELLDIIDGTITNGFTTAETKSVLEFLCTSD